MLAYSIGFVGVSPQQQTTHYGPPGHESDAGDQLRFSVQVIMRDEYPETLIDCGALAGFKFPKKGPVPGVTIVWREHGTSGGGLDAHGEVAFELDDGKTGPDGIATMKFTPKAEGFAGVGRVRQASGGESAMPLYLSAFGNVLGSLVQWLVPKGRRDTGFSWFLTYHDARGFKFETPMQSWQIEGESFGASVKMRICGKNAFGEPWSGTITSDGPTDAARWTLPIESWMFFRGANTEPPEQPGGWVRVRATLDENDRTALVTFYSLSFGETHIRVPVEEDMTCPPAD